MARSMHCTVSGRVQGVFFRAWTEDQARNLGLAGWVRNLDDGRVEVLLQGDKGAMEEMRTRLQQGSPMSVVQDVSCQWVDDDRDYGAFSVR